MGYIRGNFCLDNNIISARRKNIVCNKGHMLHLHRVIVSKNS